MRLSNRSFYVVMAGLALVGPVLLVLKLHTGLLDKPFGHLNRKLERSQRIVTVDFAELTSKFTLDLAAGDLSTEDVRMQSRVWADRLKAQLHTIARDNNLVIIPRGVGVYGADDITAIIRDANNGKDEVLE